jgi:flavin reductase (DIM6/NTAB) family NADH-FMN oxidoreductase RutF
MAALIDCGAEAIFDARTYRDALGMFPTGVAVITTVGQNDRPAGLTCGSFSSLSLDPPLVLWSLRKASRSVEVFRAARYFAINLLADSQDGLATLFSSSTIEDKFTGVAFRSGHGGSLVLDGCLASFECETHAVHDAGDHLLFIGEVKRFEHGRKEAPLVFYGGAFMTLNRSLSELVARANKAPEELNDAQSLIYTPLLRLACEHATDAELDAMQAQLAELESFTACEDLEKRLTANVEFFRLIASAARNPVLAGVAETLNTVMLRTLMAMLRHARKTDPAADLVYAEAIPLRRRLMERLRARDAAGAERALLEFTGHSLLRTEQVQRAIVEAGRQHVASSRGSS